jgi:hypothetical protein
LSSSQFLHFHLIFIPGRTVRHENGQFREILAISWKQYSGPETFPMLEGQISVLPGGKWLEVAE